MGLFSRRRGQAAPQPAGHADRAAQARAIERFWSWWTASGAAEAATAITGRTPERVTEAIAKRIRAVHPDLDWELRQGQDGAEHGLVVTAAGQDQLRAVAHRWLLAAPAPDATWEYADSRRAVPELTFRLGVDGAEVDAESVQVSAQVEGPRVHVTVHHQALADLAEESRQLVALLLLDAALGETDVETWVGRISTSAVAPLDPVPLAGLRAVVEHLRERHTDGDGDPVWALLEGSTADGSPVVAAAQQPLLPVTAPRFDTHVAVLLPYTERTEQGFPAPDTVTRIRSMEEHLSARIGGSGRLVAHRTSDGLRVLHFYVDGATPAAQQLEASVSGWEQGPVQVEAGYDPGWEAVAYLRP